MQVVRFKVDNIYYDDFKQFVKKENLRVVNHFTQHRNNKTLHLIDTRIDGRRKQTYSHLFNIMDVKGTYYD